ncbi:GntR family transcriptional regulator [Hymenobacter sp.]|jgi:DNA-binding transcriptional regulator YhcF (GntR family)|uniref:GntR family transcriptional regulator n=1 Tax=Hymenobacter sp. TaxID=1898978 RepID=UPI002ED93670
MYNLQFKPLDKTPKYKQIVQSIITDINRGTLKNGQQLPSINELSGAYDVAPDTVEKAYRELRTQGFVLSVHGKGYYVQAADAHKLRVLLIFDELSTYKKSLYYSFIDALGEQATVHLEIHHHSTCIFQNIVENNLGKYNYYVVMPHFGQTMGKADYENVLNTIPANELVLLDKNAPNLKQKCLRVFQDFDRDIFESLESMQDLLVKYDKLVLVTPTQGNYPVEIAWGFRTFCINYKKAFAIKAGAMDETMQAGTAYVVMCEDDVVEIMKKLRQTNYLLGREVGIMTFNDTPLKELLNLTVMTTDFEQMGRTTAELLLNNQKATVRNPFCVLRRGSL